MRIQSAVTGALLAFAVPAWAQEIPVELKGCYSSETTVIDRAGDVLIGMTVVRGGTDRVSPGPFPEKTMHDCRVIFTASKAGLVALTRGLAAALRSRRIAVNCVAPGPVLRPPGFPLARWKRLTRGRAPGAADVASVVVYFATCPPRVTGRVRSVGGGAFA